MEFYPASSFQDYLMERLQEHKDRKVGIQASGTSLAYAFSYSSALPGLEVPLLCDSSFSSCCTDTHSMELIGLDIVLKMMPGCNTNDPKSSYLMPPSDFCAASIHHVVREFVSLYPGHYRIMVAPHLQPLAKGLDGASSHASESILYIGPDDGAFKAICYLHYAVPIFHFDPLIDVKVKRVDTTRFISQRLRMLQLAEKKNRFGLVFASLTPAQVENCLDVIEKMELDTRGISVQIISAGKLNLVKVSNFEDLDALVIFGCVNSTISLSKQLSVPVLLPHEFICVTMGIEMLSHQIDLSDETLFRRMVEIGLVHGEEIAGKEVIVRDSFSSLTISRLHERSFQGLDYIESFAEASTEIMPGQFGTARGYINEGKNR